MVSTDRERLVSIEGTLNFRDIGGYPTRFERIVRRRPRIGLSEFETAVAEALDQLRRGLHPDRGEDVAAVESGLALLGAGRELIRVRDDGRPMPAAIEVEDDVVRFLASSESLPLDREDRPHLLCHVLVTTVQHGDFSRRALEESRQCVLIAKGWEPQ